MVRHLTVEPQSTNRVNNKQPRIAAEADALSIGSAIAEIARSGYPGDAP
jgi:hypothetical protein